MFSPGAVLHADDTTIPVLAPGLDRTRTGRLWMVVRGERPSGPIAALPAGDRRSGGLPTLRDDHASHALLVWCKACRIRPRSRASVAGCLAQPRAPYHSITKPRLSNTACCQAA
jgi:hypothetical protein